MFLLDKSFATILFFGDSAELPNVKLVDCQEVSLIGFDKCLRVKFSYLEEYAGLNKADSSSDVLVGKLYGTDGACNVDSRVSLSINGDIYYVRPKKCVQRSGSIIRFITGYDP